MTRSKHLQSFAWVLLGLLPVLLPGCSESSESSTAAAAQEEDVEQGVGAEVMSLGAEELGSGPPTLEVDPLDWPNWRGPRYDGTSYETGLIDDFDPEGGAGSNVAWKNELIRTPSTPIVMHGRLYTLTRSNPGTNREGERIVCLDAETGEMLWENHFNVWLSDVPDFRVGWSSVVGDPVTGYIYALGVCGYFQCLDGQTGQRLWSIPMHEFFGLLSTYGGRTNIPVVFEELVIISAVVIGWGDMARPAHRFVAFDKLTGEVVWFNGTRPLPYDTTYSSPALTTINGEAQMIFGSGDGQVWSFQPRTGQPIWNYHFSRRGINISPLVVGDTVFAGHSEENDTGNLMGALASIDAGRRGNITQDGANWERPELMVGKSSPVYVDGRVYSVDDNGKLFVHDAETGEQLKRVPIGSAMRASLLYADGKLYAVEMGGEPGARWSILALDEEQVVRRLSNGRFPPGEAMHASPIVSHGRVYIQTSGGLYCLVDPDKDPGYTDPPAPPNETPVSDDEKAAHVQIVPAEMLLAPGESQTLTVRLFNAKGQFLGTGEAEFSVEGPGSVNDQGDFEVPTGTGHTVAIITADVGGIQGRARARIVPALPWSFDFTDLDDPPVTWVGARYRHVIREIDGNDMMVKVSTIPKGTRSRCWFGPTDLSDYTVQADLRGSIQNDQMPDMGLIAQGYTLDLQGSIQKLEVRSWPATMRMGKTIDHAWEADTWYTMKLSVTVDDGRAIVRGKVWPRDEDEPEEWQIEAFDVSPNLTGAPGLYGNATNAEIWIDNVSVTQN